MKRRLGVLVVGAVLAAGGFSVADSGAWASAARVVCGPPSAHTLATSRLARVYSQHGVVYGCSKATGKQRRVGTATLCINSARVSPVAVAGDLAAYGLQSCGIDTGSGQVVVRRLTDGRQLRSAPATTKPLGPESYQSVASIVLRSDGAVGWIGEASSIVEHGRDIEVYAYDTHGRRLLDSSLAIGTGSLRLHGSKLTWKHGPATRTATLR